MNKTTGSFQKCIMILSLFLVSCAKDIGKVKVDCKIPETVSFNKNILPILSKNCSISGCHSGSSPAGNLNLENANAYVQLKKAGKGYVDTINPDFSLLYAQINSVSNPMPPGGKLDNCSINMIYNWILQKAKNN